MGLVSLASLMLPLLILPHPGRLLITVPRQIHEVGWTKGGHLLVCTASKVIEPHTERTRSLHRADYSMNADEDKYPIRGGVQLTFREDGKRAIGQGFVVDIGTLKSRPLLRPAFWIGNTLTQVDDQPGDYGLIRNGRRTNVARGWNVLGLSEDGKYAMACKEPPFDDVTTYLLSVNRTTGKASVLRSYTKSSNDHVLLSKVARQPNGGRFLAHKIDVASGFHEPFWASSKLAPITFPMSKGVYATAEHKWLDKDWILVDRHFFFETSDGGFDADALELWRYRDQKLVRLVKIAQYWPSPDPGDLRGHSAVLAIHALDWRRRKLAYGVNQPGKGQVYVMNLPNLGR